jgi:RNA polymerase sigma factor (TIGR02999 family)
MRRILIDKARRKKATRHGGELKRTPLDSVVAPRAPERSEDMLALDEALNTLAKKDERKVRLVELRYFVGLTGAEAAEVLGISPATADRDWAYTRAWLLHELGRGGGAGEGR